MLGFSCANCGQLEIAHSGDLDHFLESGHWPDLEFGEEVDDVDTLYEHQDGYTHHLIECPGFEYHDSVTDDVLVDAGTHVTCAAQYLEEKLAERVKQLVEKREDARIANYPHGGGHTYISFDPRSGQSLILYGE